MVNSRASDVLELLDKHVATGTEASYTFTPVGAINDTKYSYILVIVSLKQTAAFVTEMIVNASVGTTNHTTGRRFTGSGETDISIASAAHIQLLTVTGSADHVFGEVKIFCPSYGTSDIYTYSTFCSGAGNRQDMCTSQTTGTHAEITSIKIETSTSTWIAGSTFAVYGVKR